MLDISRLTWASPPSTPQRNMRAIPKTKVEELIHILEPYMDSITQLDSFTLKKYKKEATVNLGTYPWAGHLALGMIAVLEWDQVALDQAYSNALHYCNDGFTRAHYGNALVLVGRYDDALRELLIAVDKAPEDLSYLRQAIDAAKLAGKFRTAERLQTMFTQRAPGQSHGLRETMRQVAEVLDINGISESVVGKCNAIAFEVLRRNQIRFLQTRFEADTQDNYVMFYIYVAADDDTVERLDDELGVELFDKVPDFHPDKYWVGYSSAKSIS
jgi:tetratricopeptide (TPR) repeat protein